MAVKAKLQSSAARTKGDLMPIPREWCGRFGSCYEIPGTRKLVNLGQIGDEVRSRFDPGSETTTPHRGMG